MNSNLKEDGKATSEEKMWRCTFCGCRAATSEFKKGICPQCGRRSMNPSTEAHKGYERAEDPIQPPENWHPFLDQYNDPCVSVYKQGHGPEAYAISGGEFKAVVYDHIYRQGKAPTSERVNTLLAICRGMAYSNGLKYSLYNRITEYESRFYIDLCSDNWHVVEIDVAGWRTIAPGVPIFRRYSHMKEIVVASEGAKSDFDSYIGLFHISANDRILIEVDTVVTFIPGVPHPIVIPIGPQGAGKSTLSAGRRRLVDPSSVLKLALPTASKELVQQLAHHYAPCYDNVDLLQDWQSDALCRAATGEGFTKRTLYSDDDDRIYNFMRPVTVNGINMVGSRPDFLDRALICELERIPKQYRMLLRELEERMTILAPQVRAYIFGIISKAIGFYPNVATELSGRLPRMADFTVWGEAVARAIGYEPMVFYDKYMSHISQVNADALRKNLVGEYLLDWLDTKEEWKRDGIVKVQPTTLYLELQEILKNNKVNLKAVKFPGAPHILTRRLNTLKSNMADNGINYSPDKSGSRYIVFAKNGVQCDLSAQPDDKMADAAAEAKQKPLDNTVQHSDNAQGAAHQNTDVSGANDTTDATLSESHRRADDPIIAHLKAQERQMVSIANIAAVIGKSEADTRADLQQRERVGDVFSPREGVWALVKHEVD